MKYEDADSAANVGCTFNFLGGILVNFGVPHHALQVGVQELRIATTK